MKSGTTGSNEQVERLHLRSVFEALSYGDDIRSSEQIKNILLLTITTMQDLRDVCDINVSAIDFSKNVLQVGRGASKTGRFHSIPLTPFSSALLRSALEARIDIAADTDIVFPSRSTPNVPISPATVYYAFRRMKKNKEWPHLSIGQFKQMAIMLLIYHGVEYSVVSRILGRNDGARNLRKFGNASDVEPQRKALMLLEKILMPEKNTLSASFGTH